MKAKISKTKSEENLCKHIHDTFFGIISRKRFNAENIERFSTPTTKYINFEHERRKYYLETFVELKGERNNAVINVSVASSGPKFFFFRKNFGQKRDEHPKKQALVMMKKIQHRKIFEVLNS